MDQQPLAGRTVAVPETRELEVFAAMLERRGASVVRCPLVAIHDAPDRRRSWRSLVASQAAHAMT